MLHVVLYQPEIPQNTGSIGRTCVALGAKLWLVQPLGFQLSDRRLQRAGLDYWEHLDWEIVADWAALEDRLDDAGSRWLFTKNGARLYSEVEFEQDDVLVFGAESRGLPKGLLSRYDGHTVRLPQPGPVRSINLASAVAVGLYEATRRSGEAK